jgi:hypothetical protein
VPGGTGWRGGSKRHRLALGLLLAAAGAFEDGIEVIIQLGRLLLHRMHRPYSHSQGISLTEVQERLSIVGIGHRR